MALSPQDRAYLDAQVQKGLSPQEAWSKFQSVKQKLGVTSSSGSEEATFEQKRPKSYGLGTVSAIGTGGLQAAGKAAAFATSLGGLAKNPVSEFFSETADKMGEELPAANEAVTGVKAGGAVDKAGQFAGKAAVGGSLAAFTGGPIRKAATSVLGKGIGSTVAGTLAASPVETTAFTASSEGRLPTKEEVAAGAVIDAASLGVFSVLPKLASGTKNVFNKLYSAVKNKGASEMTVETINQLRNSTPYAKKIMEALVGQEELYMKDQISNPSVLSTVGKELFDDYTGELVPAKQAIGKEIADAVSSVDDYFPGRGIVGMTTDGTITAFESGLKDIGVKVTDAGLDFSKSGVQFNEANQNALKKVYGSLLNYVDNKFAIPPSEKWAIAQSLDDLTEYNSKLASQTTSSVELPLIQLKKNLMNDVKAALEAGGQDVGLFKKYADLSTAVELLNKRFGEGGEGGFSILKAIRGEQKFGQEAKKALEIMKSVTGTNYLQQVKMALAAAELAGNEQVKSLLSTTSGKGAIAEVIKEGFLDKKLLLNRLGKEAPDLSKDVLEKAVAALAKTLGLELISGE